MIQHVLILFIKTHSVIILSSRDCRCPYLITRDCSCPLPNYQGLQLALPDTQGLRMSHISGLQPQSPIAGTIVKLVIAGIRQSQVQGFVLSLREPWTCSVDKGRFSQTQSISLSFRAICRGSWRVAVSVRVIVSLARHTLVPAIWRSSIL